MMWFVIILEGDDVGGKIIDVRFSYNVVGIQWGDDSHVTYTPIDQIKVEDVRAYLPPNEIPDYVESVESL